jgi:peptidoglycan/LPS O-acetylase OafA/YrhL
MSTSVLAKDPTATTPALAGRQIFGLDIIRFGAACLVMAHHLAFAIWAGNTYPANYRYLGPFTWGGFIGVEIFFVLSGFIIAYTAENATPLGFIENRFIRLYPTAWICSTFTALLLIVAGVEHFGSSLRGEWVRSLLLYPHGSYVDGSYWTLPIEISFYCIIFALLLIKRFDLLSVVMSVVGILSTTFLIYAFAFMHSLVPHNALANHYIPLAFDWQGGFLLLPHGCFFAIGSLLWLCLLRKVTIARLLVISYCLIGSVIEVQNHSAGMRIWYHASYRLLLPEAIWPLGLISIVAAVYFNNSIGEWLGPRGARFARRLGLVTYPLYLIHQTAGYILVPAFHRFMPDIAALIVTMIVLICVSFAIHLFLEKPLQRLLRRVLHPPVTAPNSAATLP